MHLEKLVKYSVPFFAFVIISRAIDEISFIYYAVPVMCIFYLVTLFISSKFKVEQTTSATLSKSNNSLPSSFFSAKGGFRFAQHQPSSFFLLPSIWFLLTALWSSYPLISATRALYFILLSAGCISAGILWNRFSGKSILDFLIPSNIFVVLLSLFSLITNIPSDSWTGGHGKGFMGFFGQQNLLASVILFTIPAVFAKLRRPVNSSMNKVKSPLTTRYSLLTFYYLLITANLLILTLTYSRASIISLALGVIVFLILTKKWKILTYSFGIAILFFLIIYLTPTFNQFADKIIKKDFPEFYSSRIWMWEPSYRAAIEGEFTGLGYGISEPNIKPGSLGDHYEGERFIREKGNSTLALVEETGLIGLILFLFPIFYMLIKLFTNHSSQLTIDKSLLTAALTAFLLHAQFEAWWVGVGSVQLPLFFIYIGLIAKGPMSQGIK